MAKDKDKDKDNVYRGVLDEWVQEQQRGRDQAPDRWDNEKRGTMQARPGDARLERLQREAAVCTTHHAACACGQLAELRLMELCQRLERENAALREIAQAVANGPRWMLIRPAYICNFCDVSVGGLFGRTDHRAECSVTKARALLEHREGTS